MRTILHVDFNGFYASCELCYRPELKGLPLVVGGDQEARHGIVLAKSEEAKKYGIKTGQVIWEAKQKCPKLVVLPPNFARYQRFSDLGRKIFYEYSNRVQPFGLDEAWIDVSGGDLEKDGRRIADEIRARVIAELGLTASVGVADNKIFAKLGSDIKKPDATTVIVPGTYKETVWKLPVEDLLNVGRSTQGKLNRIGVMTIGDLANMPLNIIQQMLGKNGIALWLHANGRDESPVLLSEGDEGPIKSVGNSRTMPRDLINETDVRMGFTALAESVAARLRLHQYRAQVVEIYVRDKELNSIIRQRKLKEPTQLASDLLKAGMELFREHYKWEKPIRSLGIRGSDLIPDNLPTQLSIFDKDYLLHLKQAQLEGTIDDIRRRFGHFAIQKGIMLTDKRLNSCSPKDEHTIHPVAFR